jgi:amino acid transporter
VMIVAVLGGTLASLQAAIVSSSRIAFAMGRERAFPHWFGKVNAKRGIPRNATILFGLLNVGFLWGSTLIDSVGQALNDVVSTLGLMAAIFYLLTATTAIWCYRTTIVRTPKDFILGGLLPGIGALFMAFGVGLVLVGFVLSFISKGVGKSAFFSRDRGTFEDELSPEIPAPATE